MVVLTAPFPGVEDGPRPRSLTAAIEAARARQAREFAFPLPGDDDPFEPDAPILVEAAPTIPADWRDREYGLGKRKPAGIGNAKLALDRLRALEGDSRFAKSKPSVQRLLIMCGLRWANDGGEFYVKLSTAARSYYRKDFAPGKPLENAKGNVRRMFEQAEAAGLLLRIPHRHDRTGGDVGNTYRFLVAP